jgi:fucose 4-O-acetylase-like acetyltransferase
MINFRYWSFHGKQRGSGAGFTAVDRPESGPAAWVLSGGPGGGEFRQKIAGRFGGAGSPRAGRRKTPGPVMTGAITREQSPATLRLTEDLSKRIVSLRFLLIVFVVFIHNNPTKVNFADGTEVYEIPFYVDIVRHLISGIVARIAVPLFFLISGFLLYAKESAFIPVIKKKSRTILLPYLMWNVLAVVFYFTAQSVSVTKPWFATLIVRNFNVPDWIGVFTGKAGIFAATGHPLVYQFWFLRDLFILNLLFTGIKKIIDLFPLGTLALLLIFWLANIPLSIVVSPEALLFFALGYYIVRYSLDYRSLDAIKRYDIVLIYSITIIMELFFSRYIPVIHKVNIIIGIVAFIKLSRYFINNEKWYHVLSWLEPYAFFVYAVHGIALAVMTKLSVKMIPMHGGWLLLQYFGVNISGTILFVLMGMAVRKVFPRLFRMLTGGRV